MEICSLVVSLFAGMSPVEIQLSGTCEEASVEWMARASAWAVRSGLDPAGPNCLYDGPTRKRPHR
jgi:hypothetical protein